MRVHVHVDAPKRATPSGAAPLWRRASPMRKPGGSDALSGHPSVGLERGSSGPRRPNAGVVVGLAWNAALAAAWLVLFRPVVAWLGMIYSRDDFRLNQLVLAGLVVLVALRLPRGGRLLAIAAPPRPRAVPLLAATLAAAGYLASERFLDVNILSGTLFGLGSYALLGLWLDPVRWRAGLPAALLFVGTLPFGAHMDTFVGYPARVMTASIVASALAGAGTLVQAVDVETILRFETGVAHVDLPCSGVRSLWTGGLLLLAATWIEGRRLGWRWLVVSVLTCALLMAANVARVLALVAVGHVAALPHFAEMLHVPLGVLGFAAAGAAGVWMVRRVVPPAGEGPESEIQARLVELVEPRSEARSAPLLTARPVGTPSDPRPGVPPGSRPGPGRGPGPLPLPLPLALPVPRLAALHGIRPTLRPGTRPILLALFLLGALVLEVRAPEALVHAGDIEWPSGLEVSPAPLTAEEAAWLTRDGAESATRVRFSWQGLTGSLIVVTSGTWRGQHLPERCLEVRGLPITDNSLRFVATDFPVRRVSLGEGIATAVYWFQSPTRVTDDYAERMWADLARERQRWALVTVLFDGRVEPDDPVARPLLHALKAAVAEHVGSRAVAQGAGMPPDEPFETRSAR